MVEHQNALQTYSGSIATDNRFADSDDNCDINESDETDVEAKLIENGNAKISGKLEITAERKASKKKKGEKSDYERAVTEDINKLLADMPLTDDITCGFWIFKGSFFQKFANQTAYVVLYGLVGCVFAMTNAYFNGIITTLEKRFKIPSKNTGIITVGNDVSRMFVSAVLNYYAGKGHQPRWIGLGLLTTAIFCFLTAAPHFFYGPGEDALTFTTEFGAILDANRTMDFIEEQRTKSLCRLNDSVQCEEGEGNLAPQVVLFIAQFISGIGGSLYYSLGFSYMDDNIKKSKTPALLSLTYFLCMLGPAAGYALASICLRIYIAPNLNPVITNDDPRWLGAWWIGWLIFGVMLLLSGVVLAMFPKYLPRAVARRTVEEERRRQRVFVLKELERKKLENKVLIEALEYNFEERQQENGDTDNATETKASFADMFITFKRVITNKAYMCNNFSTIFYLFGYMPYWIFAPKYIEIQYRQSAATSSLINGTVALGFTAVGILLSGFVISRYKPRARYLAAWNVIVGFLTVFGILAYAFIGCPGNETTVIVNIHDSSLSNSTTCNSACNCDYVRYSPVCGENSMTYISPCHAGCKRQYIGPDGKKIFYDCSCIPSGNESLDYSPIFERLNALDLKLEEKWETAKNSGNDETTINSLAILDEIEFPTGGQAIPGSCPVNCFPQFVAFLAVMCCLKFIGSAGRASSFLVSVRCVSEKDKTASMGLGMMITALTAFIPSPIFYGWLLDRLCLVWGKTCSNKGNCWLYDPETLRYTLNFTAATLITISTLFDGGVWYYVKDIKIFDEEVKDFEMEVVQREEEAKPKKNTEI